MLKIFKNISKTTLLVGLIAFLTRTGFFMSLPFLAIYLTRDHLFTEGQIGFVLGASPLLYSLTSLVNGVFIERFTKKTILVFSLVISGVCYLGISFSSHHYGLLFLLMCGLGWIRSVADIAATTLLIQQTDEENLRSAYNLRFIAINAGAIVGPLIGAALSYQKSLMIFIVSGLIHFVLAISLVFMNVADPHRSEERSYFFANIKILFADSTLLILTLINFLIWTIYTRSESF